MVSYSLDTRVSHDETTSSMTSECTIRAKKLQHKNGRLIVVARRIGDGKKKLPCCMPLCNICGLFWRIMIDDLETKVPSLVSHTPLPPQKIRAFARLAKPVTSASSISTLTDFTEELVTESHAFCQHSNGGCASSRIGGSQKTYSSTTSTLTEFTEDDLYSMAPSVSALTSLTSTPSSTSQSTIPSDPSSPSSTPSSLSTLTLPALHPSTPTKPCNPNNSLHRPHKSMIQMSDGSSWLPPTLERIQAYIISAGSSRRLAVSARAVVAKKAENGSHVAKRYLRGIEKVDHVRRGFGSEKMGFRR